MGWNPTECSEYSYKGTHLSLVSSFFALIHISTSKGTPTGNFSGVSYPSTDPDCWWSYHQCVTPKAQGLPPDIFNVPEVCRCFIVLWSTHNSQQPLTLGYGFDDGPNCSHNAFYDFLTSQNQKASTFTCCRIMSRISLIIIAMYYIGSNVMDWPLEAQRGVVDGMLPILLTIVLAPTLKFQDMKSVFVSPPFFFLWSTSSKSKIYADTWSHRYSMRYFTLISTSFELIFSDCTHEWCCIRGTVLQYVPVCVPTKHHLINPSWQLYVFCVPICARY